MNMTLGLAFWILMLVWLVFGLVWNRPNNAIGFGSALLPFFLFLLLGWSVFGAPLHVNLPRGTWRSSPAFMSNEDAQKLGDWVRENGIK